MKYTHVGEQLYHVWSCPSNMYAMLLYNCNAVDGKGEEYPIVDANGCSRDEFLMPQITYTEDRTRAMAVGSDQEVPDQLLYPLPNKGIVRFQLPRPEHYAFHVQDQTVHVEGVGVQHIDGRRGMERSGS